jgi:hypothetical protein
LYPTRLRSWMQMVLNRQFASKQCPVRDYLSVGIIAHDPGRPVRDVFRDCHGRREIAISTVAK